MIKLAVRKVGRSLAITLPARAAQALGVRAGDHLDLTEAPDGFRLTRDDPEFAHTMKVAAKFMRRYEAALRDLAG